MIFPARNLDDSFGGFPSDVFDDRGGAPRELPWVRSPAWTGAVRPERGQASSYNYSVSVSHNNYIYLLMNVLILNHCLTQNDRASATNTTGRGKKNSDPSGQSVEVYIRKQNVWNVQNVSQFSWQTIVACHQQQDEASAARWSEPVSPMW